MGEKAEGRVIRTMVTNLEAPTPKAPQRSSLGTNLSASSVVLITVGSIKTDKAMPPAMAL